MNFLKFTNFLKLSKIKKILRDKIFLKCRNPPEITLVIKHQSIYFKNEKSLFLLENIFIL